MSTASVPFNAPSPVSRPRGVTILASLALVGGTLGAIGSVALLGFGHLANVPELQQALPSASAAQLLGIIVQIAGIFLLLGSAVHLAFGVGALQLRGWAWTLGVAAQGFGIVTNVVGLSGVLAGHGGGAGSLPGLALSAFILWYLYRPTVRRAFGHA